MKKTFSALMLTVLIGLSGNVFANPFWTHVCNASSSSAFGVGYSVVSQYDARRIALQECATRTPNWQMCSITHCQYRLIYW